MATEFEVEGKKIRVEFEWDKYPKSTYRKDFEELFLYRLGKAGTERDLKVHKTEAISFMPLDQFMQLVERTMTIVVREVIKDYPQAREPKDGTLRIVITMVRNQDFEWYTFHDDDLSKLNEMFVQFNGLWMINNIAVPYQINNSKKIDYKLLYKFFAHALTYYLDIIAKKYRSEHKSREKHERIVELNENHSIYYLYLTFENLRVEGFAEFREKFQSISVPFYIEPIRNFRSRIQALIKITDEEGAEAFYEENFGAAAYAKNTYYLGRIMCYTIGLAIFKKFTGETRKLENGNREYFLKKDRIKGDKSKGYSVFVPTGTVKITFPILDLNNAMNLAPIVYASQLPPDVLEATYNQINGLKYRQFIREYEKACNELGISDNNRIVTYAFFDQMKKEATNWYEKRREAQLAAKGHAVTRSNQPRDIDEEPAPRIVSGSHSPEPQVDIERQIHENRGHSRTADHHMERAHSNAHASSQPSHTEQQHNSSDHETHSDPGENHQTRHQEAHPAEQQANAATEKNAKTAHSGSDGMAGILMVLAIIAAAIAAFLIFNSAR